MLPLQFLPCVVGYVSTYAGVCGQAGVLDGTAAEALFSDVGDVQCLSNCSVLVAEPGSGRIRIILDSSGTCPDPAAATAGTSASSFYTCSFTPLTMPHFQILLPITVTVALSCTLMTTPGTHQGQGWCVDACSKLEIDGQSGKLAPAQSMDLLQHSCCK